MYLLDYPCTCTLPISTRSKIQAFVQKCVTDSKSVDTLDSNVHMLFEARCRRAF